MKKFRFWLNMTVLTVWTVSMSFTVVMLIITVKIYLEVGNISSLYIFGIILGTLFLGIFLTITQLKSFLRYFTLWNIFRKKIYIGSNIGYKDTGLHIGEKGVCVYEKNVFVKVVSFSNNGERVILDNGVEIYLNLIEKI